jgi:5-methylcytosine-specific restriction endonuclease McrA
MAKKGHIPWNKGKKINYESKRMSGREHTLEAKKKIAQASRERWQNLEYKERVGKLISLGLIGRPSPRGMLGHHHTQKAKDKISKNNARIWFGKKRPELKILIGGKNHWKWIKDRTKLAKKQERNDSAYREWRLNVWKRDNFKCKIANQDCGGKIKAHHILSWKHYPELRYNINNGITLCQAHHPLKRAEEKRLIPFFQGLVPVSNEPICHI